MPSSPRTPTRRRHPSDVSFTDLSFTSPSPYDDGSPIRFTHSRKSSLHTPTTLYPHGSQEVNGSITMPGDFISSGRGGDDVNGLGSLADELAGAWDDEEEDDAELDEGENENTVDGESSGCMGDGLGDGGNTRDSGIDLTSSPTVAPEKQSQLPLTNDQARAKHRRLDSQYGGSEYEDNPDPELAVGVSPGLEARMA